MFASRIVFYLARLLLYYAYGILRFTTKPGSRIIVPLALATIAWLGREGWHHALTEASHSADPGLQPESGVLDTALIAGVIVASIAYYIVSRILNLIFGAFPAARRPLPPVRALKPTDTKITSATVRVIVPPLPKRR